MASPLHYFRKHQGYILAVLGVILIVTWVIGPFLLDLFEASPNSARSANTSNVVAKWKKGDITRSELKRMAWEHEAVVLLLREVVGRAQQEGVTPQAPFVRVQSNGGIDWGISMSSSDSSLLETLILAEKGAELGVQFDRVAVIDYLKNLSGFTLVTEEEFHALAKEVVSHLRHSESKIPLVTVAQLFDRLRVELTSLQAREMYLAGVGGIGGFSTGELWDDHEQLHRRYKIEAYPIDVTSYADRFKASDAKEDELKKIYQEGKERIPHPEAYEPGFRTPLKLAFGYVKVDFQKFLDAAKKQVSEEQIVAEYEKEVKAGNFRKVKLETEIPGLTPTGKSPPAEGAAQPGETSKPAGDRPSGEPPVKPDEKSPEPAGAEKSADKPAEDKEKSPKSTAPAAKSTEESSPKDEGACQDPPANKEGDKPQPPATTKEKAEPEKTPAKSGEDKPAQEKPAAEGTAAKPADDAAKTGDAAKADEPQFRPLSEVREQLVSRLARPAAQAAQEAAIKVLMRAVQDYGSKYTLWSESKKAGSKTSVKDPGELQIRSLAEKYHLTVGRVPLSDEFEIAATELGAQAGAQQLLGTVSFASEAYYDDRPLYAPQQTGSLVGEAVFIYWRTQKEPSVVVPYDKARPKVVEAWIKQRSVEAARKDAEALAAKAAKAASLKEVLTEDQAKKVMEPSPFTWLTRSDFPIIYGGRPRLTEVPGVPLAGEEFMQAVFGLKVGETGVAINQPHTTVHVVRIVAEEPSLDIRREMFLSSMEASARGDLARYAAIERMRLLSKMIEELLRTEYQLEFVESPQGGPEM